MKPSRRQQNKAKREKKDADELAFMRTALEAHYCRPVTSTCDNCLRNLYNMVTYGTRSEISDDELQWAVSATRKKKDSERVFYS